MAEVQKSLGFIKVKRQAKISESEAEAKSKSSLGQGTKITQMEEGGRYIYTEGMGDNWMQV